MVNCKFTNLFTKVMIVVVFVMICDVIRQNESKVGNNMLLVSEDLSRLNIT